MDGSGLWWEFGFRVGVELDSLWKGLLFDVGFFEVLSGVLSFDFSQNVLEFIVILTFFLRSFGQSTWLVSFQNI